MYVTTDAVALGYRPGPGLRVLLIRRANEPYRGRWCLPGGFVEQNEDVPRACARELAEETGLRPAVLHQVGAWGAPGRDPRGRNVSVAYLALVRPEEDRARADTDAAAVQWQPVDDLPALGFDHADIVSAALDRLRALAARTHALFALLPDRFQEEDLPDVMSAVLGAGIEHETVRDYLARASVEKTMPGGPCRCTVQDYLAPLKPPYGVSAR